MSKTRTWPVRAIYILFALALAIGLILTTAPAKVGADPGLSEWSKVSTPSEKDWVIAPESSLIWPALSFPGGETLYVVGFGYDDNDPAGDFGPQLWKSTNYGATWKAITDKVLDEIEEKALGDLHGFVSVACDPLNADFLAVAFYADSEPYVLISDDGGSTFKYTGALEDRGAAMSLVLYLAVSMEDSDGEHNIAVSGVGTKDAAFPVGLVFRYETGLGAGWEDATEYDGWDDYGAFTSQAVTYVMFAPSFTTDSTVLAMTTTGYNIFTGDAPNSTVYLQSGTWGKKEGWNEEVTFKPAVPIVEDVTIPAMAAATAGITVPFDYAGRYASKRYLWVYVNYYDGGVPVGEIYKVVDDDAAPVIQQVKDKPWLANVFYWGYIDEGKALAGIYGDGTGTFVPASAAYYPDLTDCGDGVQVYRNDSIADMDICCKAWKSACKPPTGRDAAAVFYVAEDKAYCLTSGAPVSSYDESAFSVSFDDGDTWNQLSLIDTNIDYLSDVAVSPNCNKTMLVSVNVESGCGCDSTWLKAEDLAEADEYSGKWLRTWCWFLGDEQYGLLRLAPEEENGETVYLVDRGTDTVYWNQMETLACWEEGHATVSNIVDLAVKDEATLYALDENGDVAMTDDHGATATWDDPVDSKASEGWTIAVLGDNILVGPVDGNVCYSDDGGETFTKLEETTKVMGTSGYVTVAFDSYFDANDTIYAALIEGNQGVYRWVIGESDKWKDLDAEPYGYTGLVLDNADGNPMTSAETGGVLYASYVTEEDNEVVTGVARNLKPAAELCCEEADWDYLVEGLTPDEEAFYFMPKALKICGCLTADSNSKLFAIDGIYAGDGPGYDMKKGEDGTVWTYEDCYAKAAPTLSSPADGATIPSDPCYCINQEVILKWDRQCDACSYDIQVALDEDFAEVVLDIEEFSPSKAKTPSYVIDEGELYCDHSYYWRVRVSDAETGQIVHSWWSDVRGFTVATGPGAALKLTAPEAGATDVPITNIGFTWTIVEAADTYDFVLSANADLSSPLETKTGLTGTGYTYTGTLDYSTPHYWQVTAKKGANVISQSSVGTFTTMSAPPVTPPAEKPVTPTWVWVVIAIGAVLVIVVIVLIFRTRRV
jgi:hypothetical protein